MKFEFIKNNQENKVVCYAKNKTPLIDQIEQLVVNDNLTFDGININGYLEKDVVPIKLENVVSFYTEEDKVFVSLMNKTYQVKLRLYQIEEQLPSNFIRINKSRLINRNYIEKFDLSWSGTLLVVMKNNEKDYVSRRLMKSVKERMNIK